MYVPAVIDCPYCGETSYKVDESYSNGKTAIYQCTSCQCQFEMRLEDGELIAPDPLDCVEYIGRQERAQ